MWVSLSGHKVGGKYEKSVSKEANRKYKKKKKKKGKYPASCLLHISGGFPAMAGHPFVLLTE